MGFLIKASVFKGLTFIEVVMVEVMVMHKRCWFTLKRRLEKLLYAFLEKLNFSGIGMIM